MKKMPFIGALLAVIVIGLYSSFYIVTERTQAIVTQFGKIVREVKEPGLFLRIPFVQNVEVFEKRLMILQISDKFVQANDQRRFIVNAFALFRIISPRKYKESVNGNIRRARSRLETRMDSALRRVYGSRRFEDALSAAREEMMHDIRTAVSKEASTIGLEVTDVRIKRTDLPKDVSVSTYERMISERHKEAAQFRAEGREANLRIKAEADRKATVLVAEAKRKAEIVRGSGDAERNRIYAKAFGKDPEFFAFYRSMVAYDRSLSQDDTTMVLSPDSEFFRYFKDPSGTLKAKPAAQ